eukprot:1140183-Pelagomonas_calceolata.AAC.1
MCGATHECVLSSPTSLTFAPCAEVPCWEATAAAAAAAAGSCGWPSVLRVQKERAEAGMLTSPSTDEYNQNIILTVEKAKGKVATSVPGARCDQAAVYRKKGKKEKRIEKKKKIYACRSAAYIKERASH